MCVRVCVCVGILVFSIRNGLVILEVFDVLALFIDGDGFEAGRYSTVVGFTKQDPLMFDSTKFGFCIIGHSNSRQCVFYKVQFPCTFIYLLTSYLLL